MDGYGCTTYICLIATVVMCIILSDCRISQAINFHRVDIRYSKELSFEHFLAEI
ncbi:hypothetical protein BCV72DRAFT_224993 [Rhizopus microsporus var. microsporus]|uniref:Uncharacterized protein n=2 Tax=Rhizopus microsporus TaxID=58291 RepID=A0A2G4SQS0_RHIZD|nr:uncharacterized protein RHIMIDRAFT_258928 [Rhizopus microsporus ATCC 52813]ORE08476.1 hypothetical protein BCV72DRAFT_224993 [Rhizopus microsporus var. microsporus]PHZ11137.1 hypothetical protein RHIMIDRAFT_258928 [Rhizopus microsporus ATCC 52813]